MKEGIMFFAEPWHLLCRSLGLLICGLLVLGSGGDVKAQDGLARDLTPRLPLAHYHTDKFELEGASCLVARPDVVASGRPWIWRCRFFGAFPAVDEALLAKGWHVAWIDVANLFGNDEAMRRFDRFYHHVRQHYQLAERSVIEGFSRGGLPAVHWALTHPERVSGVYLDAPVLDLHTWPKQSSPEMWKIALTAFGLTEETADQWRGPLHRLEELKNTGLPIFIVAGDADEVVPYEKNSKLLVDWFREQGSEQVSLILKAGVGHHPHSLEDPTPVVTWAEELQTP